MKILIDFLPIALFFGAYKLYGIYIATAVLMAGTVLQMAMIYAIDKKLLVMHKVTLALILGFGSLTLVLHDERFIQWKPTVLYCAMSIGLAFSIWGMRKNFLKILLGSQLELPDAVWHRLNVAWVIYTLFMAVLNAYVVLYYSLEAWMAFKLWGYAFPLVFLLGQGIYITPYLKAAARAETAADEAGHQP